MPFFVIKLTALPSLSLEILLPAVIFYSIEVIKLLTAPGELPGCSGSRNLKNNISDLRAQVAANQKVSVHFKHYNRAILCPV